MQALSRLCALAAFLALALGGALSAVAPPFPVRPEGSPAEIARLIDLLGADDRDVRQAAGKRLQRIGDIAVPALRKAAKDHPDIDVRLRVSVVIAGMSKIGPVDARRLAGHKKPIRGLALGRDGKLALSGGMDGGPRLWDVEANKGPRTFPGHKSWVWAVALSPDGKYALSAGARDRTLRLWDVASGKEVRSFAGHTGRVYAAAFSPDGRFVLSGAGDGDCSLRLFEVESGKLVRRFVGHAGWVWSVCFSPDGARILSAGLNDRTARLWDTASGKELRCFRGHTGWVVGVAFAEGGKRALSCGRDGSVRLWRFDTGNEVRRFASSAECLVVSPDGRRLLVGENRLVRLLDVASGKVLHRFDGHRDQVTALAISGDGRRALSGGADGTIWLWGLPP